VLANLALDGLQRELRKQYPPNTKKARIVKVNLIRYADDFVVTGSSKELLENEVKPLVERFDKRGLELSQEKTSITHIETGFDLLGQNVRKYNAKMLIKPSKKNVLAFMENTWEVVKGNKAATAGHLVRMRGPKIKGWAMYQRHVCAKRIFKRVEHAIFKLLWQWAKRRHPNKGRRWVKQKYFTSLPGSCGGTNWTFFGEVEGRDGASRPVALCEASRVRIRRHIKVRSDVNPYAPRWQEYLANRHGERGSSLPARGSRPG
jgi:RNA-directed DNA polymerase